MAATAGMQERPPRPASGTLRAVLLAVGVALPSALAAAVVSNADSTGRMFPLVAVGLIGIVVILLNPPLGVVGAIVGIVWIGVVRRLIGGQSAYVENDPLIAVPTLLMLPTVITRLRARTRAGTELWLCVLLLLFMVAATGYGLTRAPALAVLRSAAFEALPVALAIGLMWTGDTRTTRLILTTVKTAVPLAAVYGLIQYFAPPAWDIAWLVSRAKVAATFGYPYAGEFRLFGPTSSPLAFATLLGLGILLWTFSKAPLGARIVLIALMVVPLLLTLVRTSVFALVVALVLALLRARGLRAMAPILTGAAAAVVAVSLVAALNPEIASRFLVGDLGGDESFLARSSLLADYFTSSVLSLGLGFGTALNGAVSVDNGFLAAFIELGFLGGLVFCVIPVLVLVRTRRVLPEDGSGRNQVDAVVWGIVAFFLASEVSAPIIQGEFGFIFWPCVGLLILGRTASTSFSTPAAPAAWARDPVTR